MFVCLLFCSFFYIFLFCLNVWKPEDNVPGSKSPYFCLFVVYLGFCLDKQINKQQGRVPTRVACEGKVFGLQENK